MSTREEYEVSLDDFIDTFVPDLPANLEISLVLHHMLNLHTWNDLSSHPSTDDQSDILKQLFDNSQCECGAIHMGRELPRATMVLDHRSHAKYAQKNLDYQTGCALLPHQQTTF